MHVAISALVWHMVSNLGPDVSSVLRYKLFKRLSVISSLASIKITAKVLLRGSLVSNRDRVTGGLLPFCCHWKLKIQKISQILSKSNIHFAHINFIKSNVFDSENNFGLIHTCLLLLTMPHWHTHSRQKYSSGI